MLTAFALVAALLVVDASPALANPPDAEASCTCPLHSRTALLFEDANHRVPDFWWEDSLEVQEINVCSQGVSFTFLGHDDGSLFLSVLVFVNPLGDAGRSRPLRFLMSETENGEEDRYRSLLESLSRVAGKVLEAGARFDFGDAQRGERPHIVDPSHKLFLRWQGESIPLRGYLDVYLSVML